MSRRGHGRGCQMLVKTVVGRGKAQNESMVMFRPPSEIVRPERSKASVAMDDSGQKKSG